MRKLVITRMKREFGLVFKKNYKMIFEDLEENTTHNHPIPTHNHLISWCYKFDPCLMCPCGYLKFQEMSMGMGPWSTVWNSSLRIISPEQVSNKTFLPQRNSILPRIVFCPQLQFRKCLSHTGLRSHLQCS